MDYIEELHSLVGDLQLYIKQNYPPIQAVPAAVIKAAPPPVATVKKPTPPLPPPKTIAMPASATDSRAAKASRTSTTKIMEPLMLAMPRPYIPPAAISLGDCLAKLAKLGIATIDAPLEQSLPVLCEAIVVSFYPPASEQEAFIQKVVYSVNERLLPCRIYLQPGLQAAAECFTLAASARAKAFILAYSQEDAPKVAEWLSYFGDDLHESQQQKQKLRSKCSLFGVELYELITGDVTDPQFKRALWSDLQGLT